MKENTGKQWSKNNFSTSVLILLTGFQVGWRDTSSVRHHPPRLPGLQCQLWLFEFSKLLMQGATLQWSPGGGWRTKQVWQGLPVGYLQPPLGPVTASSAASEGSQTDKRAGKRQSSQLCSASFCPWVLNGKHHWVQGHKKHVKSSSGSAASCSAAGEPGWQLWKGVCHIPVPQQQAGQRVVALLIPPVGILTCWLQRSFASGRGRSICTPTKRKGLPPGWKKSQNNYPSL